MDARKESKISWMILGGIMAIIVGIPATILLTFGSAVQMALKGDSAAYVIGGIGPLMILGGLISICVGIASGFSADKKAEKSGPRHAHGVFVVAKFAINEVGEMIFSNFEEDAPGGKLYVRIRFPDGHDEELYANWDVFNFCGEGMRGNAAITGRWLTGFTPLARPAQPLN